MVKLNGEIKWQNAVLSQNPHNFANNIGLINYQKFLVAAATNLEGCARGACPPPQKKKKTKKTKKQENF